MKQINALGRRKTAIARVFVKEGSGNFVINTRSLEEYFPTETLKNTVTSPLKVADYEGKLDFVVNLDGGGIKGQAEALRLGISRALVKIDEELRGALKSEGFLRRDPRQVERKKPGQPKARKKFQFSKR